MEQNHTIRINSLIALCHILDDFEEFNKRLVSSLSFKNYNDIYNLSKVSKGEKCFNSKKAKKFYQENKSVIDTINKHYNIHSFISYNYDPKGNPDNELNYFYQYISKNRENLDKIISVLEKLKELGFKKIKLNEELDFSQEKYTFYSYYNNSTVIYLENLEAIPNYTNDITYKTNGSNYKMKLGVSLWGKYIISEYDREIILNNLTFDVDRLPTAISKEQIIDKILELPTAKKEEYTIIRNSVDLSVSTDDLLSMFYSVNRSINSLEDVNKKEELIQLLSNIKEDILKMQAISAEYNKEVANNNENITETLLEKEKEAYQRRREFSRMHLD